MLISGCVMCTRFLVSDSVYVDLDIFFFSIETVQCPYSVVGCRPPDAIIFRL